MAMGIEADPRSAPVEPGPTVEALLRLQETLASALPADRIHALALDAAAQELHVAAACILVRDGNEVLPIAHVGYPPPVVARHEEQAPHVPTPASDALRHARPVLVRTAAELAAQYPHLARLAPSLQSHAAIPLTANGASFGALLLSWARERPLAPAEVSILRAFAGLVAQALWHARLLEAAQKARGELAEFVDTASVGLHWVAADGTILWANEADHQMLGYARDEYVGHNIAEFHADPANLADILKCLLAGERVHNRRAILRHKDGSPRHVLIDSSSQFDKDGKFLHTRCFTRDVTLFAEQRDLYEALVAAQSELGDGVILCTDERVTWANDAYCAMVGFTRDEVLSPDFRLADRLAPSGLDAARQRARERASGGALQHSYDATLLRKDGTPFDVNISVKALAGGPDPRRIAIVRDITQRKRAERALTEQRDLYEALLRADSDLGQGVVLTATSTRRIAYANEAFADLAGRSVKELTDPAFDPASLTPRAEMERLARTHDLSDPQASRHYDSVILRPDGTARRIEVASLGIVLNGNAHRLAICRDVTREREAEERRAGEEREARRRDSFLTRATLEILESSLDPDETLRLAARLASEEICDYASVDLLEGESGLRRIVIAHHNPGKAAVIERHLALATPDPRVRDLIAGIPRGEVRIANDIAPTSLDAHAATGEDGTLIRELGLRHNMLVPLVGRSGLLGFLSLSRAQGAAFTPEDAFLAKSLATRCALAYENANLHREARALEAKWRDLAARHERVLQVAPAQVLTIDHAGRILTINRSARGQDAARAVGLNVFDTMVPEDRERVRGVIETVMRTGEPAEYETRGILGPGETRWFNVRVGAIQHDGARGAVLISTDIEEKKRTEAEIAHVRAQLVQGEKLSALGSLVSGVAHELRTPLTFLSSNAFLLKRRLEDSIRRGARTADSAEDVERYLAEIMTGVDRINQLVEDLRRYTRARHNATPTTAPLDEMVRDAIELFRATHRHARLVQPMLSRTSPVRANVGAVQQVVLNLLQNAADATPADGRITIVTRDDPADGTVVLEVVDEGSGISKEVQERMFEPLYTTKPDGTGLGLSIVRRILAEHKATIRCESELGRGTTFRIRFPAHPRTP